ncbi:MAG: hypothetical protein WCJ35_08390 [Planctomycetota bacterium]
MIGKTSAWPLRVLAAPLLVIGFSTLALATPQVFWASDPVQPGETVLLQGCDFAAATVEVARLDDSLPRGPGRATDIPPWTAASILQASDCSLKFALPADWKPGVFACRVKVRQAASAAVLLNAPDPWWIQGDEGGQATPGGWLRVFGKSLRISRPSIVRLEPERGEPTTLEADAPDGYSLRLNLPADLKTGRYTLRVHNGFGGDAAWRLAGTIKVAPSPEWPKKVFNVLEFYGKNAEADMRKTLIKYQPIPDRTEGIQAALKKAKANGGGIVYFPPGRYGTKTPLDVPPRTVLKGEATGLVVLWWGAGRFNLDGGGEAGLARKSGENRLPENLIAGREFGIEDMSLYFPLDHQTCIAAGDRFRMRRVRVRIDHYWTMDGNKRPEGTIARLGNNFEVSDCDIVAKGTGLVPGQYGVIARNRILAGKTNCPLGGAREVIVENNHLVSMYPTAYMNIAGVGRNLYFAGNCQEALQAHQADYSFTFDAGCAAYFGAISAIDGTRLSLAADPTYPPWASEKSDLWKTAIVCLQEGRGAGQWRYVVAHHGRHWDVETPFACTPDASSIVTIVPMNGRVLVVGNRFEDANWVNAGYGTSIEVVYAANRLYRCAQLLNYGLTSRGNFQPSWYVQYLDNESHEGNTMLDTAGSIRDLKDFSGAITRCTIHRRHLVAADNCGGVGISGRTRDVVVEGCVFRHPANLIRVEGDAQGVVLRNNCFEATSAPHYEGNRLRDAVVIPYTASRNDSNATSKENP